MSFPGRKLQTAQLYIWPVPPLLAGTTPLRRLTFATMFANSTGALAQLRTYSLVGFYGAIRHWWCV